MLHRCSMSRRNGIKSHSLINQDLVGFELRLMSALGISLLDTCTQFIPRVD